MIALFCPKCGDELPLDLYCEDCETQWRLEIALHPEEEPEDA